MKRLKKSLRSKHRNGHGPDFPITINVQNPNGVTSPEHLVEVDESYELNVTNTGAFISAQNKVGVVYALHTLSQLITSSGAVVLTTVSDSPRFKYRGLLLDTARNFFTIKDMKRVLDGMMYSKINVLQWHLYDSQSFPIEWDMYPMIHENAAYRDSRGRLKVYKKKEIEEIVEYAFERNIRVIPELELPGHSAVFGFIHDSFVAGWNHTPWNEFCVQPPCGQAIVEKGEVMQIVDDLVSDIGSWFRDPVLHVGHDEVNMKSYGDIDVKKMMRDFEVQLVGILERNGKRFAGWDEIADVSYLVPKDALVTIWRSPSTERVKAAVQAGFQNIVVGPSSHWYLDCSPSANWCSSPFERMNPPSAYNIPGFITYPGQWHNWTTVYSYDVLEGIENKQVIKGGFGALWTETVKRHNLDRYLWPRLGVIGERLWSYDRVNYDEEWTGMRLRRFRASLVNELGIDAAEIGYLGNEEGMVYRPELCDGVLEGTEWQLGDESWVELVGNPSEKGRKGEYCAIAKLYDTEKLEPLPPKKVKYEF
ncbi:glycoside hydrolase superfamily [Obelidium mucronatum]|nr:glycoside hydrolase superfamily [Obelidium mucronatum]